MREGSWSLSDTEEPAEVTPRRKDRFFIPISASYIASKRKGQWKDCECERCFFESLSRSFSRIRKPQTAMGSPFPGGWGDDSDIDYQSMEEAFFTMDCKASSTTIDLAGAASRFGSLCLASGCTYIYIYMSLIVLDSSSLTSGPWSLTLGPWLLVGGSMILESWSLTLGPVAAGH